MNRQTLIEAIETVIASLARYGIPRREAMRIICLDVRIAAFRRCEWLERAALNWWSTPGSRGGE
jgi:hypothetical protein